MYNIVCQNVISPIKDSNIARAYNCHNRYPTACNVSKLHIQIVHCNMIGWGYHFERYLSISSFMDHTNISRKCSRIDCWSSIQSLFTKQDDILHQISSKLLKLGKTVHHWLFSYHSLKWHIYTTDILQVSKWVIEFNSSPLYKMAAISQTKCSIAFSWMKVFEFQIKFHWDMLLGV